MELFTLSMNFRPKQNDRHDIEIVVDRFILSPDLLSRISGSIEQALDLGQGIIKLLKNK